MMQYMMTPMATELPFFVPWENAFSDNELNWLQTKAKDANQNASVGGKNGPGVNEHIRRSKVSWLDNTTESNWVYERLSHAASVINANTYKFDLTGFFEPIQLTAYQGDVSGTYGWHKDNGGRGPARKLSMVVLLSDPSEFEGGNLQIRVSDKEINIPKKRGLIIAFPSWATHQVAPVTKGNRQSLVVWIHGPAFR